MTAPQRQPPRLLRIVAIGILGALGLWWCDPPPAPPGGLTLDGTPELIAGDLPFESTPSALRWSPDGQYLAISVGSRAPRILVVRRDNGRIVARVTSTGEFGWTADGALWVATTTSLERWAPPFAHATHVRDWPVDITQHSVVYHEPSGMLAVAASDNAGFPTYRAAPRIEVYRGDALLLKHALPSYDASRLGNGDSPVAFSPDGRSLLIGSVRGSALPDYYAPATLSLLDLATNQRRELQTVREHLIAVESTPQDSDASWDPDGRAFVYGDGTFGIDSCTVQGRRTRLLASWYSGAKPRVSADGAWVAFVQGRGERGPERLAVASRDGRRFAIVSGDAWSLEAWDWHPRRAALAWVALPEYPGPYQLYIRDIRRR